jgi:hypothetical protein
MVIFSLYGTSSTGCQGGDEEGWFREDRLSEPMAGWMDNKMLPALWFSVQELRNCYNLDLPSLRETMLKTQA